MVIDAGAIASVHALACAWVLAGAFDHVSDDDFARVTIAQVFAHAPRLDPSATSWLPFPFWLLGTAMAIFGRSLHVARVASIAFASLAATLPYLALQIGPARASRARALAAVAFAMISPWSLWLGASTVPESFTASFTAASAIALGGFAAEPSACKLQPWFALPLFAACLSRYESWPVAAVLAIVLGARQWRRRRAETIVAIALLVLGPLAWMVWNAHAHGSFFHFFHRVSNYKRAIGEGSTDALTALLFYPRLLIATRPDVVGGAACAMLSLRRAEVRRVWSVPLACATTSMIFLACGNVRDGAPAHHPERALLGIVFVLAMFTVDALGRVLPELMKGARVTWMVVPLTLLVGWIVNLRALWGDNVPGTSSHEDRRTQLATGRKLRAEHVEHMIVTPCAFEHFALIASFGEPERVHVQPRSSDPNETDCPRIERIE